MDASNLIKPLLANGELRCIGSTTYQEYRGIFEKDHALARRFQKIDVVEPTVAETIDILRGLKTRFEEHHGITYADDALVAAAELAERHINDRHLPDKAIDVVDEAGASLRLKPPAEREPTVTVGAHRGRGRPHRAHPARRTCRPRTARCSRTCSATSSSSSSARTPRSMRWAAAIKMSRAGLGDERHPVGSFLFAGPTGVGKTEVTRQLAIALGVEFLRFDMSEYMERHTVSRLIGAPPGYVGFDQGGLLTEAIAKQPHCVLLLDEIEKAHPDVFNLLLQVMDHGTLTDNNGRKADFRHVIIVMTTNAGAAEMGRASIGFTQQDHATRRHGGGARASSRRNSATASTRSSSSRRSTRRPSSAWWTSCVIEIEAQLEQKSVTLSVDDAARRWIAVRGYDPKMGARPMARVLQEHVKRPLAEELLFGKLAGGGHVHRQAGARRRQPRARHPSGEVAGAARAGVNSARAVDDAALGQVVGRQLDRHRVASQDPDVVLAHLAGDVGGDDVIVLQAHAERRVGQGLDDLAFHLDRFFLRHRAPLL